MKSMFTHSRFCLVSLFLLFLAFSPKLMSQIMIGYSFASSLSSTSGQAGTFSSTATGLAVASGWAVASNWTAGNKEFASTVISTIGYYNVSASFYVKSTGNGPKNFTFQFKTTPGGTWQDGLVYTCVTAQAQKTITLPAAASNQATLYLRWVQTSTTSVTGGLTPIAPAGTSSINGIFFTASALLYPLTQSSDIRILARTPTTITISWTKGGGTHAQMLMMNTVNDFTPLPVNGETFTPLVGNYSSGRQVLYNNTTTNAPSTFTITVPNATTQYYFRVFDYEYNASMARYGVNESAAAVEAFRNPLRCALATINLTSKSYGLVTANIGATITNKITSITDRGIYYSTTKDFQWDDPNTSSLLGSDGIDAEGLFSFQDRLTDALTFADLRGQKIYYKAYVENDAGKIFTAEDNFDNNPIFSGSGNWENSFLWNVKEVPGQNGNPTYGDVADNPTISGNCTLSATNRVTNLTINTGKKLTVNPLVTLNVAGTLSNNAGTGGLLIKSSSAYANGSLIFAVPGNNLHVPASVEMFSKAYWDTQYHWQYFGIPVQSTTVGSTFYNAGHRVRKYDESNIDFNQLDAGLWKPTGSGGTMPANDGLVPIDGYEVVQPAATAYTFQGDLYVDNFNRTLSYSLNADWAGNNIYANPYTSAIDITKINFGAGTDNTIYLYNTGSRAEWASPTNNAGTYTASTVSTAGKNGVPGQIPSMQGFLVKTLTSNNINATINVDYSTANLISNNSVQRTKSTTLDNSVSTRVDVSGKSSFDQLWIFSNSTCTHNFDNGWDGRKLIATGKTQLYAQEADGEYQIDAVNDINNLVIAFEPGYNGDFKFVFNHQNIESTYGKLYLTDLKENTTTDISTNNSEYSFTSSTSDIVKRFKVTTFTTALNNLNTHNKIFTNNNVIFVQNSGNTNGIFDIYSVNGKLMKQILVQPNARISISTDFLSQGIYIGKFKTESEELTQRVLIR